MQILSYKLDAFIPFEKDSIETFLCMCEDVINNMTVDEKVVFKLKSATHELLINSLEHGYNKNAGKVSFYMEKRASSIVLEISDEGSGLNVPSISFNKQNSDLSTLRDRGWGLLIIKKLSDDMKITHNSPKGTKVSVSIC
ncbi:MAG: ATP-binding protein, partial [Clostridiaceae bacterium]|nr:ATP-binding protein [Clostridiaceae bacterium]